MTFFAIGVGIILGGAGGDIFFHIILDGTMELTIGHIASIPVGAAIGGLIGSRF